MNWKSTRKLWGQQLNKIWVQTLNPLDYAIEGVLENKTDAISYQNIGSLKTVIEGGME